MSEVIKIIGGNPLIGEVIPVANKNSFMPAIPASLLTPDTVTYKNVPKSTDVQIMLEILKKLGATIDDSDFSNLKITCKNITGYEIDPELGGKIRSSVMFAGPLLARVGKVKIPTPGGCTLGIRSMSAHLDAFKKAGVTIKLEENAIVLTAPKKSPPIQTIWQVEASPTGTENMIMYAAGTTSTTILLDSASEPHVTNLTQMLQNMGVKIKGGGSNRLEITGSKNLKGTTFIPFPDHVDIASSIVAAAVTKGNLTIKGSNIPEIVNGMLQWFNKFNVQIERKGKDLVVNQTQDLKLKDIEINFPLAGPNLPKFVPRPWPGFPVDCLPSIITLATKTKGRILIQNWMYENGLDFTNLLSSMGANIYMTDPQKIIVEGPTKYKGGRVYAPGIIQATMALVLAALSDNCETVIYGAESLRRRYPDYINSFKSLGANIEQIEG